MNVIPQLLSRFDIQDNAILEVLFNILTKIGIAHPHAILSPLIVMKHSISKRRKLSSEKILNNIINKNKNIKKLVDEYEIFMDKYIEFMKSYNNSTDVASMMTQCTEIVGEYYKYMEALDKYDTDTMSAADAAYYLEVVARVEKKLLQATGY